MVLGILINPLQAEKRPWQMFFLGILFSTVAIVLSMLVFMKYSSLIMVFLTVLASFPIVYNTIRLEESKDEEELPEKTLLKEHSRALEAFMFLFIGVVVSCTLWYILLPSSYLTVLFGTQIETITDVNSQLLGHATHNNPLSIIFLNNLRVLSICVLFSFLYGVGALFILTWNATVIAAASGIFIREQLALISEKVGAVSVGHYFGFFSIGIMRYMVHGVFEILAYFIAALAGGIISVAVIRHILGSSKFEKILFDVSDLIIISVVLLFVSALVEVYITPVLF